MVSTAHTAIQPYAEAAEQPMAFSGVSISKMIERCCAEGQFDEALQFAQFSIDQTQSKSLTHPDALSAIANFVRVAVSAGRAVIIPPEYIDRLERAGESARADATITAFRLGAVIEYFGALNSEEARTREFQNLQALHATLQSAKTTPAIEQLVLKIALEACFNLIRHEEYAVPVRESFDDLALKLEKHAPSSADYYRGFRSWLLENFVRASEHFDHALGHVDYDIKVGKSDQVMKSAILEMRMRVDFNMRNFEAAEERAFEFIQRATSLGQLEAARRCNYFLAEMYYDTNRMSLAEALLRDNNLPQNSGAVRTNAHRLQHLLSEL